MCARDSFKVESWDVQEHSKHIVREDRDGNGERNR